MAEYRRGPQSISKQALQRMPLYLNYLRAQNGHKQSISAPAIAADLGLNEVQVRKDLAAVSSQAGKPKRGFDIAMLMRDIERFLGYDDVNRAVLAGAGHLGGALLSYRGFAAYGLEIVAAFDNREELMGKTIGGTQVFPIQKAPDLCKRLNAHIGIITVPAAHAQRYAISWWKAVCWQSGILPLHTLPCPRVFWCIMKIWQLRWPPSPSI